MEFRVLGSLEVVDHDGPVALGAPKQRALLAVLLLHRGEPVPSDRLIDEIWGEQPPASANKIVQGYVSNLRKVLGDGRLVTQGRGYMLRIEAGQTDVDRFEALAAEGRRALEDDDGLTAGAVLRDALAVWRGPALIDFAYEPFAQSEIARLEESRLVVLEDRIDADLSAGEHARLVGELEALVHEHPLRERLQGQLMLALYRSGRQAAALETYHTARDRLIDELGLEPGPELRELERAILEQDPALALDAPRDQEVFAAVRRRRRGGLLIAAGGALLLAALIAVAVTIAGSGESTVRVPPNSIAAIDVRSDLVVGTAAVGVRPGPIAYGSGSLWVANQDDETVSRVDPRTLQTSGAAIPLGDPPTGIATAGGGVWVVGSGPTAPFVSVLRIDPQFDVVDRSRRVDDVVPGSPGAVAVQGPRVWVAPNFGELTALDATTGRITSQFDPNVAPQGIAVGAGAVWLADNEANTVTRVDPTRALSTIPVGNGPSGIAVGADAVWVTDTGDDKVVRIDPDTRSVTTTIAVGHLPTGIAVGAGSVWVANSGDGTVTRIDPASNKRIATITVSGSPQHIIVAQGRAWVTVDAQTIPPANTVPGAGTVRVDTPYDPGPVDPAASWTGAQQLLYATCANLLNYPDKPGAAGSQLVPEVAQSLPTRSADGKSYTFTIRRGFRFSPPSNQPVTAQTFKYAIERSLNPKMRNQLAPDFRDIVGAPAYMAGKATHISGVIARGSKLTIRLTAPAGDLLARVAMPVFCAVPTDTPIRLERVIPSPGPYRIVSYTPGQGAVLIRNPNYQGDRPRRFARIEISVVASTNRAIADVEAGSADYLAGGGFSPAQGATLAFRYGPESQAAKRGHQQYFVNAFPQLDFYVLNTHRPLFADTRLRLAVSYAINRAALAQLGDAYLGVPEHPTDHYLPPGMPGYRDTHFYPLGGDLTRAKQLAAGHQGATVVLYTCQVSPCQEQAQIVKSNLAAIGLRVEVDTWPSGTLFAKVNKRAEPYDMAWDEGWLPDYLDPNAMLGVLLEQGEAAPSFVDPVWRARLAGASRLTGPERYLTYARLDTELAHSASPLIAFGNLKGIDFFSSRIGCQVFTAAYGIDLGALCIRPGTHN